METLLPSEIARLVLGYLEDQKCTEAAKLFLETSPHLQECRTVLSCGRRFNTRVNGLTLMDIVEKFSAISAMIQERLNKATDCEQLKHCGDLIEQLKFLVEEPRGQRFVSNTQTSNGLPITANNIRKRHNSERIKRIIKSQSNPVQQSDVITNPPSCHNIDTTPLESLPGNIDLLKQAECSNIHIIEKNDDNIAQESHRQCNNKNINNTIVHNRNNNIRISSDDMSSIRSCEMGDIDEKKKGESANVIPERYTTATSTEELLSFSSTEVQTIPYEIPESESESNDEPIENLSILTKEILNRTELQECIAENINKAIIPTDLSFKDENLNESIVGEGNTSIMSELNSAIKSIVEATESDPVFEKFLTEIIGPHTETDTSPEDDGEGKLSPRSLNEVQEKQAEVALDNISSPEPMIVDTRISAETNIVDVPLKHRLRSSSRQQYNRIEDEGDKVRDQEKEQSALEDQNAAAVLSIINIINKTSDEDKRNPDNVKEPSDNNGQKMQTMSAVSRNDAVLKHPLASVDVQKTNNIIIPANNNVQSKIKKSTVKRPRSTTKHKHEQTTISNNQFITEHEIMTMPTLIVCSKDEVDNLLISRSSIKSTPTSRFLPIAPKDPNRIEKPMETLYLKTVNVAQQVPIKTLPTVVEESDNSANQSGVFQSTKKNNKANKRSKIIHETDGTVPIDANQQVLEHPIELAQINKIGSESITLYGNEANAKTLLDGANLPTINLEEHISLSESGLSPYLKFSCSKTSQSHNLSDIDIAPIEKPASNRTNVEQHLPKSTDIITKRTPKSLLQSRSKNHRLSLSTPRKRSGHVRALDFSTPMKATGSNRKANGEGNVQLSSASTKRLKSVCRTSLFRSPSLSHTSQKQKSPMKVCQSSYRIPIATRSPAPKLMGGWDKCNGVGVIIGEVSPHGSTSASCSSFEDRTVQHKPSKAPIESWDADLRKSVQLNKKDETGVQTTAKRRRDSIDKDDAIRKRTKYKSRSPKGKNRRKIHNKLEVNEKCNRDIEDIDEQEEENLQENVKNTVTEKTLRAAAVIQPRNNEKENVTKVVISAADSMTNKSDKISRPAETSTRVDSSTNVSNSNTVSETKPVKKYAQLKTITTNLRKSDNENEKSAQNYSQISEMSKILSADSTQHILQMPHDMINLETPRKFDNISGPPPTPRVLSPNSITPFIKISEDSTKVRSSFITTPEFPITPGVAITPKEETTRDMIKRGEYNSSYYKPSSEQTQQNSDLSKSKNTQESPIISSSHISLHSMHNSLTSGNTYQTCSTSKLEITQFEVIKENLPREEAIKELKIASGTAELDNPVLIDHHIYKAINEYRETIIDNYVDDNYVVDSHNDSVKNNNFSSSDTSSSSSSTSSSSSSSSSSSTSSNTDASAMCSPNDKCDKTSNKINTDTSSNSAEKGINVPKDANHASANVSDDVTCKRSDNVLFESESSPKKVFAIAKTDDQIEATLKETPAKDETLLNEADISETPSSSKSGVESLTNLSTKISAIMTEDEKLSKSNNFNKPKNSNKIQILNKLRSKPKIINVQYIQLERDENKSDKYRFKHEQDVPTNDKLMHRQQLEEKRQRMIAKIKDNPKLTLANRTKHIYKRILSSSNSLKKNTQFGRGQRGIRSTVKYSHNVNENINKDSKSPDNLQENSTINTQQKHLPSTRNRDVVNKCCDNEEEIKNRVVAKNTDPGITNYQTNNNELFNNDTTKSHGDNIGDTTLLEKLIENYDKKEPTQLHKTFSSKDSNRGANVESPKQELSTVLQCLQLVPACKNEHNDENQTGRQHEELNEFENRANNESQAIDIHNYKAEYHFVYDDSMPMRKRRRRYSNHELQIEINYADLSDPNAGSECIKVMKVTEFEEIFNLPPKSKKRTVNKKSSVKNIKVCKTVKDAFILKDNAAKPLATSSPVEELSKGKVKKTIIKTAAANRNDNDTQSDVKRKQQKHQEKDITKSRKRKLSETKETKQFEKKPCMTDPQILLNNLDDVHLNELLCVVHGPE
ncbi:uncharacterized protein LOC105258201 isoform X2 [Camponotus floridanus]|uniref:uncharacterized protein LOC105258201 isoform X2 n=1 Tax=Camponotus floridanus TaxID=104421 RepID=UPI0009716D50|nr:uncharacterized protein LOC105258201 isoform X2 [Camponotus floridanus]